MGDIAVVTCGGTIAMDTDGKLRRPGSSARVGEFLEGLVGVGLELHPVAEIDSSQATVEHWTAVADAVRATQAKGPRAVIVTHGTDTLAWTAGALAATGGWEAPVVLTGANAPLTEAGTDAVGNLEAALVAAQHGPVGVSVVFAGAPGGCASIFQGGFVRKAHARGQAFVGLPERLGTVVDGRVQLERPMRPIPQDDGGGRGRRVALVHCHPALDAADWLAGARGTIEPDVVVLELYAGGTAPAAAIDIASACRDLHIPVLACPPEPVEDDEAVYESTAELRAVGVEVRLDATVELLVPMVACPGTR